MKEKKLEIWDWFEADMLILDFSYYPARKQGGI